MFSGSGAVSTSEIQRSTTVRSLYTGIRIDSFIGYKSHGSTGAASMLDGSKRSSSRYLVGDTNLLSYGGEPWIDRP